jgi:octaheme c-type cytochrome (tetrathionate reductase family)
MAAYLNWSFILLCGLGVFFSHAVTADLQKIDNEIDRDMNFRSHDSIVPFDNKLVAKSADSSTADHSKFDVLQGPFESGSDVTKVCLSCHTEAGKHFMQSIHWTWEYTHPETGQQLGKKTLINTFCTNSRGNEGMCAQCHAGYGWEDDSFDFSNQNNIDCLVCHDRSGSYYKVPPSEGNQACSIMFEDKKTIDLVKVAQSVGLPGRENCGGCHFYGGGGDGVKHGDLDSSLKKPDRQLDVHMDVEGLNFSCTQCHVTNKHVWAGSRYNVIARDTGGTGKPGLRRDVATCESCHGDSPHPVDSLAGFKLNQHVAKIACQSCHIPSIARGGIATKTEWDWRTAGKTIDGEGYKEHDYTQGDGEHRATYKSIKGSFKYGENLVPHYGWFDGQMIYTTIETIFDPNSGPVSINRFKGSAEDGKSRIWPFKRMKTIQPYDKGNNTLVYMHLWGNDKDAYWGNYDFANAIRVGMEKNGIPYSGEYDFVDTYSFWPITHMVAPKEDALSCAACHSQTSRLQNIDGIYLPGRDNSEWLDKIGLLAIMATLLAVLGHALIRIVARKRGDLS